MEELNQKKSRTKKTSTISTKKKKTKTSDEDGQENQVVEIALYGTVQILDHWGKWADRQYLVVDTTPNGWVVCEHWQSNDTYGTKFSQLGKQIVVPVDRLRIHSDKPLRVSPAMWYKDASAFVEFMRSRVEGISGEHRTIESIEQGAYG